MEIPNVLKIKILPSKVSVLVFHTLRAICILITVLKKFCNVLVSLWHKKCIPRILIASLVKPILKPVFKPQTASRAPFRGPKPASMHFAIFVFNPEKQENSFKVSTKAVNKNVWSYRSIPFMSTLFLIKAKTTSKVIIKKHADIGLPWRAPVFNVNYWVPKRPFITQDC